MYWYLLFLCQVVLCRLLVRRARKMAQDYYMLYHEPIPTAQAGHFPLLYHAPRSDLYHRSPPHYLHYFNLIFLH
jgi:hypothetical protein